VRLAVLSGGIGWHVQDVQRAAAQSGHTTDVLDFRGLHTGSGLAGYDAVLVRTMPAGSLEQVVFRMDLLHAATAAGVRVVNPPRAVETCVDKYLTDVRLRAAGLPVPEAEVCQRADDALAAFGRLGGDVVVKPLFGSEGRGMVRVADPELAWRTLRAVEQTGGVLYLQRFVRHPGWDVRAFVVGSEVIAGMTRFGRGDWRTNAAQGGRCERRRLTDTEASLARRAAAAVGADVAGVDLLPGPDGGLWVLEVNAVPGWRALAAATGRDVAADVVRYALGQA
jgi:ribosomal protein S6--L-glutamate ligase